MPSAENPTIRYSVDGGPFLDTIHFTDNAPGDTATGEATTWINAKSTPNITALYDFGESVPATAWRFTVHLEQTNSALDADIDAIAFEVSNDNLNWTTIFAQSYSVVVPSVGTPAFVNVNQSGNFGGATWRYYRLDLGATTGEGTSGNLYISDFRVTGPVVLNGAGDTGLTFTPEATAALFMLLLAVIHARLVFSATGRGKLKELPLSEDGCCHWTSVDDCPGTHWRHTRG